MATLRDLIPGYNPAAPATLGTLIPGSAGAPTAENLLRQPNNTPSTLALDDATEAAGMGQLRRGWTSGRLGAEANAMAADMSSLRAAGRTAEADALQQRIGAVQQRAGVFAPAEQDVTALDWNPGRILDFSLGAVGQGAASMLEPAGAAAGLGAASRVASAIPHPVARAAGGVLGLAAPLTAGYLNYRQGKGEFVNDAYADPETLRTKTAQEIENSAMFSGAASGALDTVLPAAIGARIAGKPGLRALSGLGTGTKTALDMGGEGLTEVAQGEIKRGTLGYLNPNRDTSEDTTDRWNDLAGGILGAGPFSLASNLAAKGHSRLGVEDDKSSDDVSGKAPKNETLGQQITREAELKKRRAPTDQEEAWRGTLSGTEGTDDADPMSFAKAAQTQHAALIKELGARAGKGDAQAQQHLDTLSKLDPNAPSFFGDMAVHGDAARDHLIGDGTSEESDDRLIAAYRNRKLNQQVPPSDLGGGKVTGTGDNVSGPKVAQETLVARENFRQRSKLTAEVMAGAVNPDRKRSELLKRVAKELAGEIVEFGAKGLAKPTRGDVARTARIGQQLVTLYGRHKAEDVLDDIARTAAIDGTPLFKALRGHVILAADQVADPKKATVSREEAAKAMVAAVPPEVERRLRRDGIDLTDSDHAEALLGVVQRVFDGDLGDEPKLLKMFGKPALDAMREVVGQRIARRTEDEILFDRSEDTAEDTSPKTSDDESGAKEEGADWERKGADKTIENAPGARDYTFFGGRSASGKEGKHPFVADAKGGLPGLMRLDSVDKSTGFNTLENLKEKLFTKLGGNAIDGPKIFRPVKQLAAREMGPPKPIGTDVGDRMGDAPSIAGNTDLAVGGTRIRTTSAKEVMDHHRVRPSERVEIMRDYLARVRDGHAVLSRDDPTIGQLYQIDRKITALKKSTPKERVLGVSPTGALTEDNPAALEIRDLEGQREETAAKLAAKIGVKYSEGMTLAQMSDAYFSDAYMVVAEQMAERDQLRVTRAELIQWARLGVRYLKRTGLAGVEARQEARADGANAKEAAQAGKEAALQMAADMNLLRFKSKHAVADDGIAVVPAHELAAWVYENRAGHKERAFSNDTTQATEYREAIMEGVAALVAEGFADELPYMINATGGRESFEKGFPPSLRLGTKTQGDLGASRTSRAERSSEALNYQGGAYLADAMRKDARRSLGHQEDVAEEQNIKDAAPVRNTDADELVDEGQQAKPVDQVLSDEPADLVGPRDPLKSTTIKDKAQFWDAPAAPTRDVATPTNPAADEFQFTGPLPQERRESRAGRAPLEPETVSTRSDENRTQLDAERKQKSGVPTDRTDLRNRNSTLDAALDNIDALTPMNAMRKAPEVARSILGVMSQGMEVFKGKLRPLEGAVPADPRTGFLRIQRLTNALRESEFRSKSDGRFVGGKQYAAPLAHILTPDNIAWMVSLAKNPTKARADLQLMRSETADALTKDKELPREDKVTLARLLTGDAALPSGRVAEALEKLAWPARVARKKAKEEAATEAAALQLRIDAKKAGPTTAVEAKTEPAPVAAPTSRPWATADITVTTHASSGYAPRTRHNADSAGLTVAIASDFESAGEKLTARVSAGKYLAIPMDVAPETGGVRLAKAMRAKGTTTLNVAGNSLHTLRTMGQAAVNQHVFDLISTAHNLLPITKIVTGGQTGVDIAGAIAAHRLGIPVVVTMPAGFRQRGIDGVDYNGTAASVTKQITAGAAALNLSKEARPYDRLRAATASSEEFFGKGSPKVAADVAEQMGERASQPTADRSVRDMPMNYKDGTNGMRMRPEYAGKSTMDLIREGVRTATTGAIGRFKGLKLGDVFTVVDDNNVRTRVRVTAMPVKVSTMTPTEWSRREGWAPSNYDTYKDAWQMQYELADKPATAPAAAKTAPTAAERVKAMAEGRKLNQMSAPAVGQAVADTQSIMRQMGFKTAPPKFAEVAAKLLTDPNVDLTKFVKDSAEALSHVLMKGEGGAAIRAALQADAWFAERAKITARLVSQGMMRGDAMVESYRVITEQALAGELAARTAAEKSVLAKLMQAVQDFVSRFKAVAGSAEFADLVRNHLNKAIADSMTPAQLKAGYRKVSFQDAVDADPQSARVLAHMSANQNITITGSIVLAHNGTVYRDAKNMLHDLDFLVTGTKAAAEEHLKKAFPNAVQIYDFNTSNGKVDSYLVPPAGGKVVDIERTIGPSGKGQGKVTAFKIEKDGQIIGRTWNDANGEHKEGDAGTFVDLFTNVKDTAISSIPFTVGGKQHSIKAANPAAIFNAKLSMGRDKDLNDYARYVPNVGQKLNAQAAQAAGPATQAQVDEAKAYIAKVLGPKVLVAVEKVLGAPGAEHLGEWIEAKNLIELSLASGPMLLSIAHHEALHALFSTLLKKHDGARLALERAMESPRIKSRLEALLADHPAALAAITTGPSAAEERVAYAYQFWAAGELVIDKAPATFFAKVRALLRQVFGMVRDSETALAILTAFHDGKLAEPSAAGQVISKIMARQTWNEDVRRKFDKQIEHLHSTIAVSNDVLRKSESATARELADVFFSNPGRESAGGKNEGYLNARTRVVRQYTNFLYAAVKGLDEKEMEAVAKIMQMPDVATKDVSNPILRKAVGDLRALTKRYYAYATQSPADGGPGLQLEFLGDNHYPRVWDLAKLVENRDKFVTMLMQPKYDKVMNTALGFIRAAGNPTATKADVADLMHQHLMEKNGVDDKGIETNHGEVILAPFFASQKERSFKWLESADVEPFLEKDLVGAMSRYLHQGIRAAEFARRFGNGGGRLKELTKRVGDTELDGSEATEDGPIVKELRRAAKEAGIAAGKDEDAWVTRRMDDIKKSVAAHEGSLGSDISPTWRTASSLLMAYQNLRLLPLSLFAAFADPFSIAARGDKGMAPAFDAMMQGLKDVWARWKDAASDMPAERVQTVWDQMAEAAGVVDSHMFLEQIGKAHTSEFMTDVARRSNRALFMANGLTAWDRSMRVTATKHAALFIADHKNLPDKQHSARWLDELGLKPVGIHTDAMGNLLYDRRQIAAATGMDLKDATKAAEKIHFAITRWVEGAVLTPTAAQRPTWASDPRWAVLFHLKQFTYSFHDTVLRRAAKEAQHGNMAPVWSLMGAVPTMMVSDVLKGFVQGGGSLPAYMKAWGFGDHLMHGISRAGLGGLGELGLDGIMDPVKLLGPSVEQAAKIVGNPADLAANMKDAIPGVRMLGDIPGFARV